MFVCLVSYRPKPLSLYLFSADKKVQQLFLSQTHSGSVCVNDTLMQYTGKSITGVIFVM